jgi:transcription elongation factor Elf1
MTCNEGNLCATLVVLAAWRPCSCCGTLTLYVNEQARTDGAVICEYCEARRDALTKEGGKPAAGCPSCGSLATFMDGTISRPMLSCGSCSRTWPACRPPLPLARVARVLRSLVVAEERL